MNRRSTDTHENVVMWRRDRMRPSNLQPRQVFDAEKLGVLALRIRGEQGVVQPLIARAVPGEPEWLEILDGERRWRAAAPRAMTGLAEVAMLPVIIRDLSDVAAMDLILQTVMQREDLNEVEQSDAFARALSTVVEGRPAHSVESLAGVIGRSVEYVAQRLALQRLPGEGRAALMDGRMSFAVARVVCGQPVATFERVLDVVLHPRKFPWPRPGVEVGAGLTEDEVRVLVESMARNLAKAPFDVEREDLVPVKVSAGVRVEGGACVGCPHNSATGAVSSGKGRHERARCVNPACYDKKKEVHLAAALVSAQEKGLTVLRGEDARKVLHGGPNGSVSPVYVELRKRLDVDERARAVDERKAPTWREMVESGDGVVVPVLVAVDEESGRVVEVAEREVAEAAAEKLGKGHLLASGRGKSVQVREARQQEEDRAEAEAAALALRRAESSAVMNALVGRPELPLVVQACLLRTFMRLAGEAGCRWVARRYALKGETVEELHGEFAKAGGESGDLLCFELMLARDFAERDTPQGASEWPRYVVDLASAMGVSVSEVCAEVAAKLEKPKDEERVLGWAEMSKGQRNKARNYDVHMEEKHRAKVRWCFVGRRCVGPEGAEGSRKDAETQSKAEGEVGA